MKITFYKYSGEHNRLNKTLTNGTDIECNFNLNYNLTYPTVKLVREEFDFNYCQVGTRYYFIDTIDVTRQGFYTLSLSLDVLMTYKDRILSATGTVIKSFNSPFYSGVSIPVDSRTKFKRIEFPEPETNPFEENGTYVMITAGYVKG